VLFGTNILVTLKYHSRAKKIYAGMADGAKVATASSPFFVPLLIGVLKGNGSAFAAPVAALLRGQWRPEMTTELTKPVTNKIRFTNLTLFPKTLQILLKYYFFKKKKFFTSY